MKKVMILSLLILGMMSQAMAKEPIARITSGKVVIAAGDTNATKTVWLNTGNDEPVIDSNGLVKTGTGIIRALMYTASGGITNASITFSAYDGGVKDSIYAASSIATEGGGRFDLTNTVYSGRIVVDIVQGSYTNAANTWTWAAIVE